MFSTPVDLCCALQAAIHVRSSWIAHAWCDGVLGALLCTACISPVWSTINAEGIPFDDAAHAADRKLLFSGTDLRSVSVIKGYAAGLYLPERTKDMAVVLGMKSSKRLQIHPLRNMSADTFIHALNDGIYRNQTEAQMQKLADRLTQLEDAMRQISSTERGDTINFDYAPDADTTINIDGVARTKTIPGEGFYQAMLSIPIGNSPVDRELKNKLLGS